MGLRCGQCLRQSMMIVTGSSWTDRAVWRERLRSSALSGFSSRRRIRSASGHAIAALRSLQLKWLPARPWLRPNPYSEVLALSRDRGLSHRPPSAWWRRGWTASNLAECGCMPSGGLGRVQVADHALDDRLPFLVSHRARSKASKPERLADKPRPTAAPEKPPVLAQPTASPQQTAVADPKLTQPPAVNALSDVA